MRAPLMKNIIVDLELSVNELIDPKTRDWCPEALEENFFPREVDLIKKSKPVFSSTDFKSWKVNKSGDYSVRSGYWLACQSEREEVISLATMLPSVNGIKDQVWKLFAPSKIKLFIWKAANGALAVAERLISRGMKVDTRCATCGMEGESINHLLSDCSFARQVWAVAGVPLPESVFDNSSIYQNLHFVLSLGKVTSVSIQIRRTIPWILWSLWKNRNNLVFEGQVFLILDMVSKIRNDTEEWFQAQEIEQKEESSVEQRNEGQNQKWRPSSKPWLKCNVASSWDKDKANCGASWVLRNSLGSVLLHSRMSLVNIGSKEDSMLQTSLWAMKSMKSLHIPRVVFALEASELVGAINRPSAWPNFKLQSEELLLALSHIPDWRAVVEHRKGNLGAFLIAKSVTRDERPQSYVA
ncbi:PREDICTED: uncharacterized protein LOC104715550 [Camelina sativa]|uniref:Uncharacterized protein LOC104715550 n=1 Tax=Camelina sativa TaxID=90675 RepID=A0ABM0TTQ3_CAMSA|nr:PREDICTED: uncharacterized protein LOC104715550 [Camelina sativa]